MIRWNGTPLLKKEVDMIIDSDASLIGWGCNLSEPTDQRSMVPVTVQYAYKLSGTIGRDTGSPHISEEQKQNVRTPQSGQHHSSGLHQQSWRNSLHGVGRLGQESVDVVFGEKHSHHSTTPTRGTELYSQCGVSDNAGPVGMATEPGPVQQDCEPVWPCRSGHVCLSSDNTVPSLFQLAARSLCSSNRCLSAGLVSDTRVCQPTLEYDRKGPVPGADATGTHYSGGTSLEDTTMVPTTSANVDCSATSDQRQSGDAKSRPAESHPSAGHMEYLRERYQGQELSEDATSLMLKPWRTKTNRSYDSLFSKWCS